MKICMIAYAIYEYDGRVRREAEALLSQGHQVDIICLGEKNKPKQGVVNGAQLYRVQSRITNEKYRLQYIYRLLKFLVLSGIEMTRLYFKERYSVIHVHNLPDFEVFAALIPKLFGAKIILDIHDVLPEFYARKFNVSLKHPAVRILQWVEKISARFADHVITVTEIWRERLSERSVAREKCSVILNAPDENLFPQNQHNHKNRNGALKLIYTGTLKEHSGIDVIIRAIKHVRQRISNVCLDVYGMGEERGKLEALSAKLEVVDSVHFHDAVPIENLSEILVQADIGVDPKKDGIYSGETLSVKSMEFLAVGLPAIVSKTIAAQAYYDDSMVAFFKPDEAEDLAKRILELYQHPKSRREQSRNGRKFFKQHSWQQYKKKYVRIVEGLAYSN